MPRFRTRVSSHNHLTGSHQKIWSLPLDFSSFFGATTVVVSSESLKPRTGSGISVSESGSSVVVVSSETNSIEIMKRWTICNPLVSSSANSTYKVLTKLGLNFKSLHYFLKYGPTPASFSFIFFRLSRHTLQILQQIGMWKNVHPVYGAGIQNSRPLAHESTPITTRPGHPSSH